MDNNAYAVIIGGGASGIICACRAAETHRDKKIILLEKADRIGKKLLITGNGRCNLSNKNAASPKYHGEGADHFVNILLQKYNPDYVIRYLEGLGLSVAYESDGRVYPSSYQSSSVLDVLRMKLEKENVNVICGADIKDIQPTRTGYRIISDVGEIITEKLVIATGGAADYTGKASASGEIAKMLGLRTNDPSPSLSPVYVKSDVIKMLKGIRVRAKATLRVNGKDVKEETGEVQFTDGALSGICIFNLSRVPNIRGGCVIKLSLLPDLSKEETEAELRKRIEYIGDGEVSKIFIGLFHKNIGIALLKSAGISPSKRASTLSDEEIGKLTDTLFEWNFTTLKKNDMKGAQVTAGGIKLRDVICDNFEHIAHEGLFIIGEALDVDGDCGGYNLQFAFASGLCAGENL